MRDYQLGKLGNCLLSPKHQIPRVYCEINNGKFVLKSAQYYNLSKYSTIMSGAPNILTRPQIYR